MPTTPATRLGWSRASDHTTRAPQSWPTNTARSRPSVVEHAEQVVGQVDDVVVLDGLRAAGPAVAAHVRRQHVVAGVGERRDLVAPRVRQLREAVDEDDGMVGVGVAVLDDVEFDVVRADRALSHQTPFWQRALPATDHTVR